MIASLRSWRFLIVHAGLATERRKNERQKCKRNVEEAAKTPAIFLRFRRSLRRPRCLNVTLAAPPPKRLTPREKKKPPATQGIHVTVLWRDNFTLINCNVPLILKNTRSVHEICLGVWVPELSQPINMLRSKSTINSKEISHIVYLAMNEICVKLYFFR